MRAFTLRSAERQVELQEVPGAAPNEHLPAATQGFIKQILATKNESNMCPAGRIALPWFELWAKMMKLKVELKCFRLF